MGIARHKMLRTSVKLLDMTIMVFSFVVATLPVLYENGGVSLSEFFSMRVRLRNFLIFLGFLLVWHIILASLSLYQSRRLLSRRAEILDTIEATTLGTICLALGAVLCHVRMIDALFVAVFWGTVTTATISDRLLIRFALGKARKRGRNLRHVLIVGTNPRAINVANKFESRPELGYRVVGFVDEEWDRIGKFRKIGYTLVSDLQHFREFVREAVVDEVIIALPIHSYYAQASRIAAFCEEQGIVVRILPGILGLKTARSNAEEFESDSLLTLYTGQLQGWGAAAKRALDFTISACLLVVLIPVFVMTAALIKLTSPGPIFFTQERLGLNKRRFRIFKFRTMVPDAEQRLAQVEPLNEVSGPVFKIRNDPRLTPLGKLLRKTSIDELPQLLNVMKGEMSLVGPRPLPVRDYEGFDQDWQRRRFSVRPGITCLWQMSGRNSIPFNQWMKLDMEYIDHWSLWLDFKILMGTIPAVVRGSGAA